MSAIVSAGFELVATNSWQNASLITELAEQGAETNRMYRNSGAITHRGRWGDVSSRLTAAVEGVNNSRINEGLSVFTEHRHGVGAQPGLTHAYGVQYAPDSRWTLGVSLENGRVGYETLGELRREAIAFNAGYSSDAVRYSGGAEYRSDRGSVESRRSWLLKNAFSLKDGEDARWVGKLNWADSDRCRQPWASSSWSRWANQLARCKALRFAQLFMLSPR